MDKICIVKKRNEINSKHEDEIKRKLLIWRQNYIRKVRGFKRYVRNMYKTYVW